MLNKNILVVQSHPNKNSFVSALAQRYYDAAVLNDQHIELVHLADLNFDLVLHGGYKADQKLEEDLVRMQSKIKACDHLVFFFPMWWGTMPALLKGFIDRTFLPGFAFKYGGKIPEKLLKGKSARYVVTMDSPGWYYKYIVGAPLFKMMKNSILGFSGFSPVKKTVLYNVKGSNTAQKNKWLKQVEKLGFSGS